MPDAKPTWSNEEPPRNDGDVKKWGGIALAIVVVVAILLVGLGWGLITVFSALVSVVTSATH